MSKILQTKKLIMITGEFNNNKFYYMFQYDEDPDVFHVEYGRVDVTSNKMTYPISKWNSKYNEKIKKGYKDMTDLIIVSKASGEYKEIESNEIKSLVDSLLNYAKTTIKNNYTITAESVTRKQLDRAQTIINEIVDYKKQRNKDLNYLNKLLLELYTVIPRKMKKVQEELFVSPNIKEINDRLEKEQSLLDTLEGQVQTISVDVQTDKTILDAMNIEIFEINEEKEINYIKEKMGDQSNLFSKAFKLSHKKSWNNFSNYVEKVENKSVRHLWHGSRNENWWNILVTGLLIKPAGSIHTGSMFGAGLYFADRCKKSVGYTSLRGSYWASGSDNKAYLSLFKVHLGISLHIQRHESWCYDLTENKLKNKGNYDSLFAEGGIDLVNNEFIVYNTNQATIRYIVEIKS